MIRSILGRFGAPTIVEIQELAIDDSDRIHLPASVDKEVFQRALYIAQNFSTYEGKGTGALLILSERGLTSKPLEAGSIDSHLLRGHYIKEPSMEGPLRKAFSQDGGILIDGESGEILTELSQFYPQPSEFVLSGHGCRHRMALDLAAQKYPPAVSIARSSDGFVTVFSHWHLNQKKPKCFRIRDRPAASASLLMPHTPLIRFDDGEMYVPAEAKKSLEGLEPPLRVVALLGPGRTGKSTLAGHLVGDQSVFPSAKSIGPVTEGINAAAVPHPEGGTLLVLDGEGFNNPFAPSRKEVATLCLLLASVVVSVGFDRMDEDSLSSLNELMACSVIVGPESEKLPELPNLFLAINGCRFCEEYDDRTLEKALEWKDGSSETNRNSIRERIKRAFPGRSFCTVPWNSDRGYASAVNIFRDRVVFEAHPLNSDDFPFDGSMFFELLSSLVEKCNKSGKIDTQDIYNEVVRKRLMETADQAIANFLNHYPMDAEYREELAKQNFDFDYNKFLQPLSSEVNHRNSDDVQKYLDQCLQTMTNHAKDVWKENKRKGDEVVESKCQTRWVLIDRRYEKQSNAWAIVGGASGGVLAAGGPVAVSAVAATPFVGLPLLGLGAVGAAVGGWGASRATQQYTMISRYELQKRYMKMQANGERCFDNWTKVNEFTDTEKVNQKKGWTRGEVSHESESRLDGNCGPTVTRKVAI